MDKFVLNLIHRPEMVPEYSATVTGPVSYTHLKLPTILRV